MKNIIKKAVALAFLVIFSLSAFGMIDSVEDKKVKLSDQYDIEIKESIKRKIENHNVELEMVAKLYSSSIENPSTCFYDGKAIFACSNQKIVINILKSDNSIVDFYLNDEEND